MKLSNGIGFCVAPLPALILLIIGYTYYSNANKKTKAINETNIINTAGRQRMLSQKIAKDALTYSTIQLEQNTAEKTVGAIGLARKHMAKTIGAVKKLLIKIIGHSN